MIFGFVFPNGSGTSPGAVAFFTASAHKCKGLALMSPTLATLISMPGMADSLDPA